MVSEKHFTWECGKSCFHFIISKFVLLYSSIEWEMQLGTEGHFSQVDVVKVSGSAHPSIANFPGRGKAWCASLKFLYHTLVGRYLSHYSAVRYQSQAFAPI